MQLKKLNLYILQFTHPINVSKRLVKVKLVMSQSYKNWQQKRRLLLGKYVTEK